MQTDAAGSHSGVTDGNSLNSALFSLGYLDSFERQIQNHVMAGYPSPSALGEAMISFNRGQASSRVADDFWRTQPGTYGSIHDMEGISPPVGRYATFEDRKKLETSAPFPYPFESPKTVITSNSSILNSSSFGSTNYSFEGLPFVGAVVGRTEVQPAGNSILNEWILTEQEDLNSNNPGPSRFNKELSLSLATSQEQRSEMSSSGGTLLHKRQIRSENTSCSSNSLSLNFNSGKPTLQLPPMLSGSRFFHAMQEILAEIACYALENFDQMSYSATGINHDVSFSSSCSRIGSSDGLDSDHRSMFQSNLLHKRDVESKKKHLLSLLQVVDAQYNQCLDEIHTVISAFHAVTELDPNLHARFALPTISLMYRNLRERISSYILAMGANLSEGDAREESSFETSFIQEHWALQQLRKRDHQLWRPQRGLPERSVSVLKAWMFQNFLHPYPKDAEKHLLALKSGLTRSQVSNWFINARVRLWKPMIEEMYAEMNRRKTRRNDEEINGTLRNQMRFDNRRFTMD